MFFWHSSPAPSLFLCMSGLTLPGGLCIHCHLFLNDISLSLSPFCSLYSTHLPWDENLDGSLYKVTTSFLHLPTSFWHIPLHFNSPRSQPGPHLFLFFNCDSICGWFYPYAGSSLVPYRACWVSHDEQASKQHPPWPLHQFLPPGSYLFEFISQINLFNPPLDFGCSVLPQK